MNSVHSRLGEILSPVCDAMCRLHSPQLTALGGGLAGPMHRPDKVDDLIEELMSNPGMLGTMCERVRQFALDLCFEREFAKRTTALHEVLGELALSRGSRRGASKLGSSDSAS